MTRTRRFLLVGLPALAVLAAGTAAVAATLAMPGMGTTVRVARTGFHGYYDGHVDTFLSTDVSSRTEATAMHMNFSPVLAKVPDAAAPDLYLFEGKTAPHQLPVFSSEPGEKNYSPIWDEAIVSFKPGTTPFLLTSDTDIEKAIKAGQLSE